MRRISFLTIIATLPLAAQTAGVDFFERKIRPALTTHCYACHSSKLKAPMGGLLLDSKAGLRKVITPGNPAESRLFQAVRHVNPKLQMPPTGKLPDSVIADFEQWIAAGAVDPREDAAAQTTALKGMTIEDGRKWWAFQPVHQFPAPKTRDVRWTRNKIDAFILAKLEESSLRPSTQADARTLIRRASLDLLGLPPTYEESEAFVNDRSPDAYERLIDRLLASPHYGERWGRYWLDVARYAEDNPTSEATNPPYPYAWRYRDWVIESFNKDLPYDKFVKLQLAADRLSPDRNDLRALGFLGAAPIYHKDARLSKEVIETLATDDWDERVDAVTRGLLGLTVACARCHDHKFDPITTKDYYSLAGVFASSPSVLRPLGDIDTKTETRFLWLEQRLFDLSYLADLMKNEPGTKKEESVAKEIKFRAEIEQLKPEVDKMGERYPELRPILERYWTKAPPRQRQRGEIPKAEGPFTHAVYDAGNWVDGSDPDLTMMEYRPGAPRELPVFLRGNVASPGEPAPRRFLSVLSKTAGERFTHGSGRADLAEKIFSDATPLAARVIVNRVWAWHFGKPLVPTLSDYGTQGEKPSHPELLDDLAARFVASGWSFKWLHREIMLSAAYRQSSKPRADADQADPTNRLLWRMNPRRLDIEAFRDSILKAAGTLSEEMSGPSTDLEAEGNSRRTVYSRVSRGRLNTVLRLYDFADPTQHSPSRDLTTTPLQQLFMLNSPFIQQQAAALAQRVESESDATAKVRSLYRRVLARDPDQQEVDLALSYLARGTLAQYAQALLSMNELIFWP